MCNQWDATVVNAQRFVKSPVPLSPSLFTFHNLLEIVVCIVFFEIMKNFFEIQLSGIFDGTKSKSFQAQVQTAIQDEYDSILVNCDQVTFMDSSGLGSLISALKITRNSGKEFYLCAINQQINMLFSLTDTLKIFQIYPDRETFCSMQSNG